MEKYACSNNHATDDVMIAFNNKNMNVIFFQVLNIRKEIKQLCCIFMF